MAYYSTCPDCGAHLDPGEPCDCREEKELERAKRQSMFSPGKDGQMQMLLTQEVNSYAKMVV